MSIANSRTFRSGNSEAVRLPKDVAYGRDLELTVVRSGDVLTIFPKHAPIDQLLSRLATLPRPEDVEARDEAELPEPPGL